MVTEAHIYTDPCCETHGTEFVAYYAGVAAYDYSLDRYTREAFRSDKDWQAYRRGIRFTAAEDRLNADTEWD